jgi:hypothetical protein
MPRYGAPTGRAMPSNSGVPDGIDAVPIVSSSAVIL